MATAITLPREVDLSANRFREDENSYYLYFYNVLEQIEKSYILENPREVKEYLLDNNDLIPIVNEAPEYINRIFGYVPIFLELHHDPEENWDELFIVIKTNYPPEKAVELEIKLFDEWFINIMDKVGNRLNFIEKPL